MERPFAIIDGDGHITETEAQVRAYLPEPYRSRGGSLRAGHGYWNINLNGTLGKEARDHKTWLDAMDEGGMETAVLFPTSLGFTSSLVWEPDLHVAICKAYNDFVYDEFATNSPRLKVIASLPVQDVDEAIAELGRVKNMGFVGAMLPSIGKHGLFGHRKFLPLFEEAQKLDIMLAVHSATQGIHHLAADDFERFIDVNTYCFPVGLFRQFVSMMFAGIPELFPNLRVGWMEAGCSWVPYWLDRMDEKWEIRGAWETPNLKHTPTKAWMNGNWWVHTEAEEKGLPYYMEAMGPDKVFFASDFPHWDGDYPANLDYLLNRSDLTEEQKRKVMGENARALYKL